MAASEFERLVENQFLEDVSNPLAEHWRKYSLSTNERGEGIAQTINLFTDFEDKRVLDVGVMHGGTSIAAKNRGGNPLGMDVVSGYFRYAKANMYDHKMNDLPLATADIQESPFRDASFDIVICSNVIEHVPSPRALAGEIARILRPSGVLYLSVPNKYGITQLIRDEHYGMPLVAAMPRWLAKSYLLKFSSIKPEHIDFQPAYLLSYWNIRDLFASVSIKLELATRRRMQTKFDLPDQIIDPNKKRIARLLKGLGLSSLAIKLYHSYPSACFLLPRWTFVGIRM